MNENREQSVRLQVRVTEELKLRAERQAQAEGRSLSNWIKKMIDENTPKL